MFILYILYILYSLFYPLIFSVRTAIFQQNLPDLDDLDDLDEQRTTAKAMG
jgi:hypothetical protein